MKSWVKLYTEENHDPVIGTLGWAERGVWHALLCLAGEMDSRDGDGQETGELDTVEMTAWRIRCDLELFKDALHSFLERQIITEREGVLFVTNYPKRQARAPSASPEAIRKRVAEHRARKRNEAVTSRQRPVTPSDTDTDTDSEKKRYRLEPETERDQSGVSPSSELLSAEDYTPTDGGQIARYWESMFGRLDNLARDYIDTWVEEYGQQETFAALRIAYDNNVHKKNYVEAVLKNRKAELERDKVPRAPPSDVQYYDPFTQKTVIYRDGKYLDGETPAEQP